MRSWEPTYVVLLTTTHLCSTTQHYTRHTVTLQHTSDTLQKTTQHCNTTQHNTIKKRHNTHCYPTKSCTTHSVTLHVTPTQQTLLHRLTHLSYATQHNTRLHNLTHSVTWTNTQPSPRCVKVITHHAFGVVSWLG